MTNEECRLGDQLIGIAEAHTRIYATVSVRFALSCLVWDVFIHGPPGTLTGAKRSK